MLQSEWIDKMKLDTNLKLLIKKNGLNVLELARKTGIGQPFIHRIFSGETNDPKLSTVCTLADYFGITVNQLVGDAPLLEEHFSGNLNAKKRIPVITWREAAIWPNTNIKNNEAIFTDIYLTENLYVLRVKDDAMRPIFNKNTLLVIDVSKKPKDGNFAVIKLADQIGRASCRERV
jgi:transcriptional regulator with XRE-family HTH domain